MRAIWVNSWVLRQGEEESECWPKIPRNDFVMGLYLPDSNHHFLPAMEQQEKVWQILQVPMESWIAENFKEFGNTSKKSMKICSAEKFWSSPLNYLLARGTVYIPGIWKFLKVQSSKRQWKKSQLEPPWEFPSFVEGALCIPHASQPRSWRLEQFWTLCVPEYISYLNIFHLWQYHTLRGQHWGQTWRWDADHGNYSEYSPDLQLFLF